MNANLPPIFMRCRGTTAKRAFTLLELLAVMLLVVLLMGMIMGAAGIVQRKGFLNRTRAEIANYEALCEAYKGDRGVYPGSLYDLDGGPANTGKHYITYRPDQLSGTTVIDPFGTAYAYSPSPAYNIGTFDLYSFGPNRTDEQGSGDDVANFKR